MREEANGKLQEERRKLMAEVAKQAEEMEEIVECHRVTGSESHVLRARIRDVEHLGELVERFWEYGDTITNIVTSTPVQHRQLPSR